MAFDKKQFRALIVDTLKEADLYSESAVELLMLTCAVESNFGTYIEQITGPALGVFQMEPRTHDDIWDNYLMYKREHGTIYTPNVMQAKYLKHDLKYAILMSRYHYLRVPEPLPAADDLLGLAAYWKQHYNTHLGAGTVDKAVKKYKEYCV